MSAEILEDLEWRGLVAQTSGRESLVRHLRDSSRVLYCGFDPTADSLHVGSLIPLLALRRFQLAGHRPIALVGGATGLIGDPSFKGTERALNDVDVVERWAHELQAQVSRFLDFDGNNGAIVVDNLSWTRELDVISFLRDIGKHFSVNAMIAKDAVRQRLSREGSGISFTEFSYIILQSLDYLELAKRYGCSLQVGGSDQWGNITAGMDLVRRVLSRDAHGLTFPLATQADGTKFGKTEAGTVWLDARKTSPYAFFQFWMNSADADVIRMLKWFTFLQSSEIDAIEADLAQAPERRRAQQRLAEEVTRLVHGDDALQSAKRITAALFNGDIDALGEQDLAQLRQDGLPSVSIDSAESALLVAVLERCGAAASRSAARRLIQSDGIRVNGKPVTRIDAVLDTQAARFGRYHLIRRGKRHWYLAVHAGESD